MSRDGRFLAPRLPELLPHELLRQRQRLGQLGRIAAAGLGDVLRLAAAPAAHHLRHLLHQVARVQAVPRRSSVTAPSARPCRPRPSRARPRSSPPSAAADRSAWRICSTGAAGTSPMMSLAPPTSGASASSSSAALLRSLAVPFFSGRLQLLHLLLQRLDARRHLVGLAVEHARQAVHHRREFLHRRHRPAAGHGGDAGGRPWRPPPG